MILVSCWDMSENRDAKTAFLKQEYFMQITNNFVWNLTLIQRRSWCMKLLYILSQQTEDMCVYDIRRMLRKVVDGR